MADDASDLPGNPITRQSYGSVKAHSLVSSGWVYGVKDANFFDRIVVFVTKREANLANLGKPFCCSIHGDIVYFDQAIYGMRVDDAERGVASHVISNDYQGLRFHRDHYYKDQTIIEAVAREFPKANTEKTEEQDHAASASGDSLLGPP